MILLDQTVVAVATVQFQIQLHASLNQVVWITSIYLLFFAVPLLVTGRLGDRFGQRNVYIAGMALFVVSSLLCGLAPSIEYLIAARALQGLGAAILSPQPMSVINRIFVRERRGAAMGVWGAVAGLATLVGPILGAVLVHHAGWRWIFFINVPLGLLSIALVFLWVPRMPHMVRSLDLTGVWISIVAMSALVFAIQQGPELQWPWWLWSVFGCGIVATGIFFKHQAQLHAKGEEPLVPLNIFRHRNFSLGTFSIATMSFAVASLFLPMMIFLQQGHGLNPQQAGLFLTPMAIIAGVLAPFVGRLSDKLAPRILSTIGFSAMVVATFFLVGVMRQGISYWWIIVPVVLLGFGNGFVWSPNSATSLRDLPMTDIGAASGVYAAARQLGSVLGTAVVGAAMQYGLFIGLPVTTAMGMSLIAAGIALIFGLIAVTRFTEHQFMRENSQK